MLIASMIPRIQCALIFILWSQASLLVHAYSKISDDALRGLRRPETSEFDIHIGSILSPILIPRVPGTEGSSRVLQHFVSYIYENLPEWTVEIQNSTSTTPTSNGAEVPFRNFIAYRDPPNTSPGDVGRLTLVAHYDSLQTPEGFIGAIDSAAPCAMILHAAKSINAALTSKWTSESFLSSLDDEDRGQGIQILFLDGEEAFLSWTATDSVYGARSLSFEWDQTYHSAQSTYKTRLESISLFLLLDLLGSPNPVIPSYFKTTHWAYQRLAALESRLRSLSLFASSSSTNPNVWFPDSQKNAHDPTVRFPSHSIQDDHIPFMARGVEVLHIIPSRFPGVWHTLADTGENLDIKTVEDWSILIQGFIAEWLSLDEWMEKRIEWDDVGKKDITDDDNTEKKREKREKILQQQDIRKESPPPKPTVGTGAMADKSHGKSKQDEKEKVETVMVISKTEL